MKYSRLLPLLLGCAALSPQFALADGNVLGARDLEISSQHVQSVIAGRDLVMDHMTVDGKLAAGRRLVCHQCSISGSIAAGDGVQLDDCNRISHISSGGDTSLTRTHIQGSVSVGRDLLLSNSTIEQQASTGGGITAKNSTIKGDLSLGGHSLRLDHTRTGSIRFSGSGETERTSGIYINGGGISMNGNINVNSGTLVGNHMSIVNLGANSMSVVNGYVIKSANNRTTLITPEQSVYVNGRKASGAGPESYADYRATMPCAPNVNAPGWVEAATQLAPNKAAEDNTFTSDKPIVNVLTITNGSVVQGDVNFESGFGKVIIESGSALQGKVINGMVENSR